MTKSKQSCAKVPRPLNQFFIFKNTKYPELKKLNPNLKVLELSKLIAQEWRKLDEGEKLVYKLKADEMQKKHLEKFPNYKYKRRQPYEIKRRRRSEVDGNITT